MPALGPSPWLGVRQDVATGSVEPTPFAANNPPPGVPVVCAWPVSGQYGPGTRILYYVLVAACVVARKVDWLRNACIAAALLFPVTAGVHGIVLAAVHTDGAVDMDIYGALQLCAIGVLVAPISVRLSSTYSNDKGRNIIFVWSGIILAGLLSLVVEFYRWSKPHTLCSQDENGNNMTSPDQFPYNATDFTCGLVCSTQSGPYSLIRTGSANNIYVVPVPTVLTFSAATLLAAACCIPTLLLPASMWIKILRQNQKKRDKLRREREAAQATADGTSSNIASLQALNTLSDGESQTEPQAEADERKWRKIFQKYPLALVFGGVVIAVVVLGEKNLFSRQVVYQTDFMQNVGQWAPLVGTGLAVMGSGYLLLAGAMEVERGNIDTERRTREEQASAEGEKPETTATTIEYAVPSDPQDPHNSRTLRYIARVLIRISDSISNISEDSFENHKTNARAQQTYPAVPGEEWRNINLQRTETHYTHRRNSNDSSISHISRASRPRSSTAASESMPQPAERTSDIPASGDQSPPPERKSSESPAQVRVRRDTLDVPHPRRSTNSTLPSPPLDQEVHTPTSPTAPTIIIHEDKR